MPTVNLDNDVAAFIKGLSFGRNETVSDTLRRVFNLGDRDFNSDLEENSDDGSIERKRRKNTSLRTLVDAGRLKPDETVVLCDSSGQRLGNYEATIQGEKLLYKGQLYSMSDLAGRLLRAEGYASESVRGPAYWLTESGKTLKDLWEKYLDDHSEDDGDA